MSMSGNNGGSTREEAAGIVLTASQALEIARDNEEEIQDPIVSSTLENAIGSIWRKIEGAPETYILTRDEFAVFNYFQARFAGQPLAVAARKRYWDHLSVSNGGN